MASIIKTESGREEIFEEGLAPLEAFNLARELNETYYHRGLSFKAEFDLDENPPHRPPKTDVERYAQVPLKAPRRLINRIRRAAARRRIPMARVWQEGAELWLEQNGG